MNSDSSEYERHHVADPDEPNSSDSELEYECTEVEANALNTPSAEPYVPTFNVDFGF